MSHACFISFKKEDAYYRDRIVEKLGKDNIMGKTLDRWINSEDLDYVMQVIRDEYMTGTSVTLYLIGAHSSEKEGRDALGRNMQSFMIRELQATLFDRKGNRRSGLLGIVLPEMEDKIYGGKSTCPHCGACTQTMTITDDTVLKEFSANYWLKKKEGCNHYEEDGRFCVLVRYSEFMNGDNAEKYIENGATEAKRIIVNTGCLDFLAYKAKIGVTEKIAQRNTNN